MSLSVIEGVKADIITTLQTISTTNGYRNDVSSVGTVLKELSAITSFPELVVVLNNGHIDALDMAKTSFAEFVEFAVLGYVSASTITNKNDANNLAIAAESLIHDLKKCLAAVTITNINNASLRSLIAGQKDLFRIIRLYADNASKGIVGVTFTVLVRYNSSSTF